MRERFPLIGTVRTRWSGQATERADGAAYLDRSPLDNDDVYVITGDSGTGMTHCAIGAMVASDLILGQPNDWVALYDPARKAMHALGEFVKGQAHTLAHYKDLVTAREVTGVEQIAPGQGAVPASRREAVDGVPRRAGGAACVLCGVHAPRLRGALQPGGEVLGLPLPFFALCS